MNKCCSIIKCNIFLFNLVQSSFKMKVPTVARSQHSLLWPNATSQSYFGYLIIERYISAIFLLHGSLHLGAITLRTLEILLPQNLEPSFCLSLCTCIMINLKALQTIKSRKIGAFRFHENHVSFLKYLLHAFHMTIFSF